MAPDRRARRPHVRLAEGTRALISGRRGRDVPQSRGMEADDAALRAYSERGMERERLSDGRGDLEFTRTTEIVLRRPPAAPAVVADIGGGPGRYALWVASLGYQVEHLDLPDASVDAVLLLGPLYHLTDRAERVRAPAELRRRSGKPRWRYRGLSSGCPSRSASDRISSSPASGFRRRGRGAGAADEGRDLRDARDREDDARGGVVRAPARPRHSGRTVLPARGRGA